MATSEFYLPEKTLSGFHDAAKDLLSVDPDGLYGLRGHNFDGELVLPLLEDRGITGDRAKRFTTGLGSAAVLQITDRILVSDTDAGEHNALLMGADMHMGTRMAVDVDNGYGGGLGSLTISFKDRDEPPIFLEASPSLLRTNHVVLGGGEVIDLERRLFAMLRVVSTLRKTMVSIRKDYKDIL